MAENSFVKQLREKFAEAAAKPVIRLVENADVIKERLLGEVKNRIGKGQTVRITDEMREVGIEKHVMVLKHKQMQKEEMMKLLDPPDNESTNPFGI